MWLLRAVIIALGWLYHRLAEPGSFVCEVDNGWRFRVQVRRRIGL